jgi:hypothetical protein
MSAFTWAVVKLYTKFVGVVVNDCEVRNVSAVPLATSQFGSLWKRGSTKSSMI